MSIVQIIKMSTKFVIISPNQIYQQLPLYSMLIKLENKNLSTIFVNNNCQHCIDYHLSHLTPSILSIAGSRSVRRLARSPNLVMVVVIYFNISPIIIIFIIITRPKPAYGGQGLADRSLRASGAQLGSGK